MDDKVVVCLPTYNEARNISFITAEISQILPRASILIIDDNSPDGTGFIADQLSVRDSRIHVLHRQEKQGLGKAYADGFRYVFDEMDARFIVQMDADLSHSPKALLQMLDTAKHADLVIGSRYVKNGSTQNWNLLRRLISRFGSLYARCMLNIPVYDLTGGFKLWRRDLLAHVMNFPISSGGYVFQVETTWIAYQQGATILEVPIAFIERNKGKSKMTVSIAIEAFWRIPMICLRSKSFFKI